MADKTPIVVDAIIQKRHYTAVKWTETNPVLYEGEMGFETDTDKFKFGTGAAWNSTPYADSVPVSTNRAPTSNDSQYRLGQLWLDTAAAKLYWLKALAANVATWIAVPNDETIQAMLDDYMAKSIFAKNGGAAAGKVDHALKADELATARKIKVTGDVAGEASFNGSADAIVAAKLKEILSATTTVQGMPTLTVDKTGRITAISQMSASDARALLQLGTAALKNAGNAAGNVPLIGADGKLDTSIMPQLVITDVKEAASQAEMLALTAQQGDVCLRTDESKTYILAGTDPKVLANWKLWLTPGCDVLSVNGKTGVIVLTTDNINEGSTNLYWTAARFNTAFAAKSTSDLKEGTNLYFTEARVKAFMESNTFIFNGNGVK